MFSMWKYLDNVAMIFGAVMQYFSHRDEQKLVVAITNQLIEAVKETVSVEVWRSVDVNKILFGVKSVIEGFSPLLDEGKMAEDAPPEVRIPR